MGADQASIAADPRLRGTDAHCPQLQPIGKSERANPSVVGADHDPIPGHGWCVSDGAAAEVVPADCTGPAVDAPNLVAGGAKEDGIARKDRMGSEIIGGAGNEGLIDLLPEAAACLGGPGRGRSSGIDGPRCDQCVGRGPGLHEGGSTAIASGCRCACLRRYRHKQSPKSQDPSDASEDPMRRGVRFHSRILKERQLVRVLDERTVRRSGSSHRLCAGFARFDEEGLPDGGAAAGFENVFDGDVVAAPRLRGDGAAHVAALAVEEADAGVH